MNWVQEKISTQAKKKYAQGFISQMGKSKYETWLDPLRVLRVNREGNSSLK